MQISSLRVFLRMFSKLTITVTTSVAGGQTYTPDNQPVTRVMTSNLLASSQSYDEFIAFIQSKDPDVIVFQEYTGKWHDALSTALVQYRFKVTAPIETPFGIALYSKLPISENSELALVRKDRHRQYRQRCTMKEIHTCRNLQHSHTSPATPQ